MISRVRRDLGGLRGQMFDLIEAVGLPERQETALKRCVRRHTYDAQGRLEALLRGGG
jgi:hypothetical protein